jgi:Zn finger protein HypA/HybF involved in hydrogenase expression
MKPELQKQLVEKYPKIFTMVGSTPQQSCMAWGICTGDGWYWLLDNLCKELQHNIDVNNQPQIVAAQVKEKFGGLRFYVNAGTDEQYGAIHFAEMLSYSICETCGTTEGVKQTKGWINSLCEKCAGDKGKVIREDIVKTDRVRNDQGGTTYHTEFQDKKKFICDKCGEVDAIMFNGYTIAERLLEGVMIKLTYDEDNNIQASLYSPADDAFCHKLNMQMHFKEAVELAESGDLDNSICCICQNDAWRKEDETTETKESN